MSVSCDVGVRHWSDGAGNVSSISFCPVQEGPEDERDGKGQVEGGGRTSVVGGLDLKTKMGQGDVNEKQVFRMDSEAFPIGPEYLKDLIFSAYLY